MTRKKRELLPFWFPESQREQIWAVVFITLVALSIDWWAWSSSARIGNWMPVWVYHLIVVQLILAYSIFLFSKEWRKDG